MKKLLTVILVSVFVLGIITSAYAQSDIYKVGVAEEPTTKNFWAAIGPNSTAYNSVVTASYYGSLFELQGPTYRPVPVLAADNSGEFVKEGEYYTTIIHLRQDLEWSNGVPFTADDVVFTYSTIIDLNLLGNWATYHPSILVKVEKVDDYHVKFYLQDEPGLAEWIHGILQCSILSSEKWGPIVEEAKTKEDPSQYLYAQEVDDPVTLRGMDFAKWEKGAFWQNVKANNFTEERVTNIYENGRHEIADRDWSWSGYGEEGSELDLTVERGPFIDSAVYQIYTNQEAVIMSIKKGDIDYYYSAQGLTKGFAEELSGTENVEIVANDNNGFRFLAFNRARYPFTIPEFSQAVATLIDREFVMDGVLQGAGQTLATVVPPGNTTWHNPDVKIWGEGLSRTEKVAEAVEILEGAGFSWETKPEVDLEEDSYTAGSGIIKPDGEKMEPFSIMTPPAGYDPMRATWGLYLQLWMADLGIPAQAKPTQFNVISEKVFVSKDFDAFVLGWGLGNAYPDFLKSFFHSEGGFNVNGFSDEKYDELINKFMSAQDQEEAIEYAFKAQDRFAETLPYIVLFSSPVYDVYRSDRVEYPYTDVFGGLYNFYGIPAEVRVIE